ncbi:MAG TPA: recombination mediator RecR [Alphaproteobacteria bacterium]|nr:recombination mediator RecR [Alphaproteobacteria bacterium]
MIPLPLERLLRLVGRLPGLGPRSAQRVVLHLLTQPEALHDVVSQLADVGSQVRACNRCGNLSLADTCGICTDTKRDDSLLCVVEGVADVWAIEKSNVFKGRYFVLGGLMSALDGVGPEDVRIPQLVERVNGAGLGEVIVALPSTIEGQTTAHLIADRLLPLGVAVTAPAKGMPVGSAVDYLDEGTLAMALSGRKAVA